MSACPRPAPTIDRQAAILSRRLSLALILCTGAAPAPASGTDPGLWVLALNRQLTQQFGAAGLSDQEPVRWRLMPQAGGWRLSDIVVSGISFAAVLQAQFAGVLRTRGGGLPALLTVLRAHGEG